MTTEQYSKYWLDQDLFDDDQDSHNTEDSQLARLARLVTIRRAIGNFVSIVSGKNVPVNFSTGKTSFATEDSVTIAADDDPTKFDPMVGLALHEGAHILLSNFKFLKELASHTESLFASDWWASKTYPNVYDRLFMPELVAKLPKDNNITNHRMMMVHTMINDLWQIMNILEDRRIDQYVYRAAPGYRPYYQALYDKYFFTSEIGKNLKFNPAWREITVENYLNRLTCFFHPDADHTALPGLDTIIQMANFADIDRIAPDNDPAIIQDNGTKVAKWKLSPDFCDMPIIWQEANRIYAQILKYVELANNTIKSAKTSPGGAVSSVNNTQETNQSTTGANNTEDSKNVLSALPTVEVGSQDGDDIQPTPVQRDKKGRPGKFNEKKGKEELEKLRDFMNGKLAKKRITKKELMSVDALDKANAELVDISGNGIKFGRCMVTRKMTDELLDQEWFIFKGYSQNNEPAISAGKRMGEILVHRLQVRNDPLLTKQTRLPQGGLDRRLLAQLGMDITSVFQKSRVDQHRPVMLHLTIDASGSMSGRKWSRVCTVATAIAYVASKLRNVDAVISIRGGHDMPVVHVIYDSRKDQFKHFVKYMTQLRPNGATPEGLCFKATLDLILENADTHDVYFINFSDGEPAFSYKSKNMPIKMDVDKQYVTYFGLNAFNHTKTMIQLMRDRGVKVLSYFISNGHTSNHDKQPFKIMYGEDAVFCNVENATEVLKTLNKLLLIRGG